MKIIVDSVRWREFGMGMTIGMLFLLPWSSFFGSVPYTDVEITKVDVVGTEVLVTANFNKNECTFKRLEVFGTDFGETNLSQVKLIKAQPTIEQLVTRP